jgi:acyl-CoA thioesterase-1
MIAEIFAFSNVDTKSSARTLTRLTAAIFSLAFYCVSATCEARQLRLLVLGDSLSSGYMLPENAGFTHVLARRLLADGYPDVQVIDGSAGGATTSEAATRIARAGPGEYGADLVLVELGGNDMLDGVAPETVFRNLNWIVANYKASGARVILAGMLAKPKLGPAYNIRFDTIYPALAARWKASLYPFFLQGVFGNPALMLSDNKHPNSAGAERIVAGIAPIVERNVDAVRASSQ